MLDTNHTNNFSPGTCITLAFLMTLLAFAIILGNAAVILAFVMDSKLRQRSSYFLLNLAISDFFVGAISIPLYIPYTLFNWDLRDELCTFWLLIDYLLCTASVYNIVLISYDRYQSVSNALQNLQGALSFCNLDKILMALSGNFLSVILVSYRAKQTEILKIVAPMVAVWVLAFLVHGPIILVSQSWKKDWKECEPGFFSVWYIIAITSFFEFLVPVILVAYFNVYIYRSLWKRGSLSRRQSHPPASSNDCGHSFKCRLFSRTSLPELEETGPPLRSEKQRRKGSLLLSLRTQINTQTIASQMLSLSRSDSVTHQRERLELLRAKKLAKSLAILLGVFAICWAPYSVSTIFLSYKNPKPYWYEIAFWLQWLNSFVNPFLYPLCHKRFQKAFLKIFCMKKKATSSHSPSVSS